MHSKIKLTKNLFIITLVMLVSFSYCAEAQHRRSKHKKHKTIVHKEKHGRVHTHKTHRKRVKRTRVVHHHYKHLPRRGTVVATMNSRAPTVKFGGIDFRFHSGVWYKPRGPKWVVARPSHGIRIRVLPVGHRRFVIGTSVYYYYYGAYYVQKDEEYEVVEAPMGAEIGSLPDGYKTVTVEGRDYYELDGIYYMPSANKEGEEILVVIENPNK